MESTRLHHLKPSLKWALSAYLLLSILGFAVAALISHDRYAWDHKQTEVYYLGDESQMAYPKPFGSLIQAAHVHSFAMPLVFGALWLALNWVPLGEGLKKAVVIGGAVSVLLYNGAPFMVRYVSAQWVTLFTWGGVGLFVFYVIPALLALWEVWFGWGEKGRS